MSIRQCLSIPESCKVRDMTGVCEWREHAFCFVTVREFVVTNDTVTRSLRRERNTNNGLALNISAPAARARVRQHVKVWNGRISHSPLDEESSRRAMAGAGTKINSDCDV